MNQACATEEFFASLNSLRDAGIDPALKIYELQSPRTLAPLAATIAIETIDKFKEHPIGTAILMVLWDSDQEEVWGSCLRLVGHMRIQIDKEQVWDPIFTEVIWHSFTQSLDESNAQYLHLLGTVTRELSETFGGLVLSESALNLDLRCSWTPASTNLTQHLEGWARALMVSAGVPDSNQPLRRAQDLVTAQNSQDYADNAKILVSPATLTLVNTKCPHQDSSRSNAND